jgi:hypothetical protein
MAVAAASMAEEANMQAMVVTAAAMVAVTAAGMVGMTAATATEPPPSV